MFLKENGRLPEGAAIFRAFAAWLAGALVLLLIAAPAANAAGLGERGLGYLSSAISFFAAVTAGRASARGRQSGGLLSVLVVATALVTALLTVGFLIRGRELNPSAILSIVSFSYAGVLLGSVLRPRRGKRAKRFG